MGGVRPSSFINMPGSTQRSDQFDIRINVGEECEHLHEIEGRLARYWGNNQVRYYHISGIERGNRPEYDSYGKLHVHIALVLENPTSIRSVRNKLGLTRWKNGFYLVCRNKALPLHGWLAYHSKMETKVGNQEPLRVVRGIFPQERSRKTETEYAKTKRLERQALWSRKKYLIQTGQFDLLDEEFPGFQYSPSGVRMKTELLKQRRTKDVATVSVPLCVIIDLT